MSRGALFNIFSQAMDLNKLFAGEKSLPGVRHAFKIILKPTCDPVAKMTEI